MVPEDYNLIQDNITQPDTLTEPEKVLAQQARIFARKLTIAFQNQNVNQILDVVSDEIDFAWYHGYVSACQKALEGISNRIIDAASKQEFETAAILLTEKNEIQALLKIAESKLEQHSHSNS